MKTALILSGGGSNGAFQAGALEQLSRNGVRGFDTVYGSSVGALNGALCQQPERLLSLWESLAGSPRRVFIPRYTNDEMKFNAWRIVQQLPNIVRGRVESLADPAPLLNLIRNRVNVSDLPPKFRFGITNIHTGEYELICANESPFLHEKILAAASMPPFFPPVNIAGNRYADSGLRAVSPLRDFLRYEKLRDYSSIWVINCRRKESRNEFLGNHIFGYLMAGNQVMSTEIFKNNTIIPKSARQHVHKFHIIEPDGELPDTFDFSEASIKNLILQGKQQIKRYYDQN
jgi:predicted acylesterase/phospholipase RssA